MEQQRSRRHGSGRLVAATTAAILVVAGAGVGSTAATGSSEPQRGGTLIVAGGPDVFNFDPAAAYSAADYQLMHMTLRGLFDYKAEAGATFEEIGTARPDMAVEIATQEHLVHAAEMLLVEEVLVAEQLAIGIQLCALELHRGDECFVGHRRRQSSRTPARLDRSVSRRAR